MSLLSLCKDQFDIFYSYSMSFWGFIAGYIILKGAGGAIITSFHDENGKLRFENDLDGIEMLKGMPIVAASNEIIANEFNSNFKIVQCERK